VLTVGKVRPWLNTALVKSTNHMGNAPRQVPACGGNNCIEKKYNIRIS
jgi:hypothetical protein